MAFGRRLTSRRIALFCTVAVVLLALGWMQATGAAGLSGMPFKAMDWNEDGRLTRTEVLQGFFTVSATRSAVGPRSCVEYRWRRSGEVIRTECRTEAYTGPTAP